MGLLGDLLEQNRKIQEQNVQRWNKVFGNTPFAAPPPPPRKQALQAQAPAATPPHAQAQAPAATAHPPQPPFLHPHYDPRVVGAKLKTGEDTAEYYMKKGMSDGRAQEYKPPHAVNGFIGHWVAGTYFGLRPPFDMFGKPRSGKDIHSSSDALQQANIDAYNEGFKQGRLELPVSERMKKWWL